jgi:hypothetical protein
MPLVATDHIRQLVPVPMFLRQPPAGGTSKTLTKLASALLPLWCWRLAFGLGPAKHIEDNRRLAYVTLLA